jgi:hypothetical protein
LVSVLGIVAPKEHCEPSAMFGGSCISVGSFYLFLNHCAPARLGRPSVKKPTLSYCFGGAAVAAALPYVIMGRGDTHFCELNNNKSPESEAGNIFRHA